MKDCCAFSGLGRQDRVVYLVMGWLIYTMLGALVFTTLEMPEKKRIAKDMAKIWDQFLQENECVADEDLRRFISSLEQAQKHGVRVLRNATDQVVWTFGQSFFFVGSLLSTIGYDDVSPLTGFGQVFCLFYAAIGMAPMLIALAAIADRITMAIVHAQRERRAKTMTSDRPLDDDKLQRFYTIFLALTILVIFIILIPAAIFFVIEEDWDFFDAFFFCIMTATSVGVGGSIPGDKPGQHWRTLYKIFSTIYMLLALISAMVFFEITSKQLKCKNECFPYCDCSAEAEDDKREPGEDDKLQLGKEKDYNTINGTENDHKSSTTEEKHDS